MISDPRHVSSKRAHTLTSATVATNHRSTAIVKRLANSHAKQERDIGLQNEIFESFLEGAKVIRQEESQCAHREAQCGWNGSLIEE